MKDKIELRGRNELALSHVKVPIFIGNFYVLTDFAVVEDMDPYVDEGMGEVVVEKPFCEVSCVETKSIHQPVMDESIEVPERTVFETFSNISPENKAHYDAEKEAIHLLLTRIGDEIYSTVDACKTTHDMWIAIERLQQDESLNKYGVKTSLFWEFGRFTSRDGESIESYYSSFFQKLQPEWSRFVTIVKQTQDLDTISYHKLFDILKQYQKEVNKIRAEKITKNANPLALVTAAQQYPDTYYQAPTPHRSYVPLVKTSPSIRSHATIRYKGKKIAKSITPPSKSGSEEDSEPEQAWRDKEMQKNLALITKYFKKINKPTNNNLRTSSNSRNKNVNTTPRYLNENETSQFRNPRTVTVVGARETVGSQVVQQTRIQCFNCKEFRHFAKESEKCVPLQAEQANWLEDTDEEVGEQELEAHYNFMAKIQEVLPADSGSDAEPLKKVDNNVIPDSSDMCDNDNQADQNAEECDDDCAVLANLIVNVKLDTDENKKTQNQLKKANTLFSHELQECKSALEECKSILDESNKTRDGYLVALHDKEVKLEKYKIFKGRTIENEKLKCKLKETLGLLAQKEHDIKEGLKIKAYEIYVVKEKKDELVKHSLLTKSSYEGLLKEKNKVIKDLKLKEGKDIDKLIVVEKQLKF
ncbi:hypothetical protein Tco_0535179 [Tanacetum coccineum]